MCTPQCFIEKCGGLAFDEAIKAAKYVLHYTKNLGEVGAKMTELGHRVENIRKEVCEANDRGEEIDVEVSHWQPNADRLKNDIEQLISDSTTKANMRCIACSCPNITWRYKLSKQAEEKIRDADKLIKKSDKFKEIAHPRPRQLESLSDKNYVNFDSRVSIFKDIMGALKDSNVNMIGVFGLGGVGKTTLVKEVGEQMRKDGTFKQVAMAVVSKDLNVKEVQSKLADSLNFEFKAKADDQERRATELWNKFTNGDKYLIILDDIWEKVDLKAIGIPITDGKTGCKVVLTSRNEDLLSNRMEVNRKFSIGELLSAEAWTLFTKKVGNSFESQPELYSIAYKVCTKCKGLPIAINALGEALKGKQEHAWVTALDKLEKYMLTKIEGIDPGVLASLRVSYDMLHSADAKSCFLLCCLFAEDAEIPIAELMRICVARNLLDQNPHTLDKARNAVRTVVDTLKSASLLTTGSHETVVKIHDVIRDVGISIAREDPEEAFLVEHGALRWPRNPTNEPLYKTMSLSFKNIKGLPDGLVYPRIHTLMVDNTNFSDLEVGDNFFNGMTQLVVLTITRMRMKPLPSSLAKLANLKMLYLNKCKLADIATLKDLKSNLEVLSLRGSSIKVLPPEIGQLTSLRVLDLQDCDKLMVIPRGVISNLTGLEELYFPMTFDKWEATTDEQPDTNSTDNASLEELRELLAHAQLTTLHIHVPNVKLLPKKDLKFANLKGFRISVGSKFNYHEALISRTCMLKLEGIQLRNEFIPLVDKAEVLIIGHYKLKYLFSPTAAIGLVHLEVLKVTSCEIMEGIIGFEGQKDENEITGEVKLSKLKQLELTSLPNLISFFAKKEEMGTTMGSFSARAQPLFNELVIFPVLERLTIDELGNIIKIWDKQSIAVLEEQGSFGQLKSVDVKKCTKLMHVFLSNMHPQLKNLERLEVYGCETMKGITELEGEMDEDGHRSEVASSTGEHLEIVGVTEIQDKQPLLEPRKEVEFLCKLMRISIEDCDQLLYVFPSHMLPQNLQELYIGNCNELEVIFSKDPKEEKEAIDDDIIVFPRLKEVRLRKLPKLKSFYTETQGFFSHKVAFPVLERLSLDNLDKITRIWDNQPLSELEKEAKSFSELKNICVHGCCQLEYLLPSNMLPQLKNILQVLYIWFCTKMEVIISNNPKEKEATNNNDTIRFPQLKEVWLWDLPNLKSFICSDETQLLFSNKVAFPILKRLLLAKLDKIIRIWDNQPLSEPEKEAKSFCELTEIIIDLCDQLEYVLPSYMLPQLKNLQKLDIRDCVMMEVIISNNPTEKEATNNNYSIRFPQLKTVLFWGLPNLKSFICSDETQLLFSNKVDFLVLETLKFKNLHKITRIWDNQPFSEPEKEAKSFCQLMKIEVKDCDQLEYVLPLYMLPQLKNLQRLHIEDCTKMEVIISNNPKEKEATNNNDTIRFPQLKKVELWGSPNLKSFICSETQLFFSNKDAFPVLEEIDLDEDSEILRDGTYMEENNKMADTSAAQARKGKDIQGIPWERLNITREKRRQTRLERYKNYEDIPQSGKGSEKDCNVTMKGDMYYEFRRNSRSVKSTINHFQCRDFVWATSKHDVYLMSHFSVTHWSALTCNKTEVLNFSGHVAPCEKHPGSLLEGFSQTEVSTLAVKDRLLVAGGFKGELICKNLDRPGVHFCTRTTYDYELTNVVEIYSTQSGAVHLTVANNDCGVRDFDMEKFKLSKNFRFPWPVNHTSLSPDGKLRIIVGDNPEGMLVDSGTGKMVASLIGHLDFSLASAWHPDGLTFATGNQDKTCRIWDARNLSKSVAALRGNLGSIQPIRYSSDGRFMVMAEPADFVHVFDVKSGYEKEQEIDFFGEISGMSFSPDTESLFIGVCDANKEWVNAVKLGERTYGGLLEFGRRRNNSCPDSNHLSG